MAGIHFDITGDNDNFLRKIREVEDGVRTASRHIKQSGLGIEDLFKRMKQAAAGFFTLRAASDFARKVANVRGEFQQLEVAFRTMLGSADKADALMQQLVKTAATTPFGLQDVAQGAKQLLAYGLEAEKVNGTLIRLGDIAAGLSIPLGDLVYLYGTTMAQGRLYTQDLNQFTGRGIPMIAELARQFGVAESEVRGLVEAGKVGFPEVQKVIESLTNEGGKFGGLMEAQSKTITGQISNIEDAISTMFNEIGQKSEGAINTALSGASYMVENYEKVGRMLLELVGTYGTYKTALMGLSAIENLRYQMTLAHMAGLTKMQAVMTVLREKAAGLANPYALAAAAIAGLAYGIYKLATYQTEAEKAQKKLNEATAAATGAAAIEQSELARLKGRLQACKEGTEEYGRVKEEIVKKFGQYDSGLKAETLTVESLAEKYDGLTQAILKSYNARQYEKFSKEQAGEFEKTVTKYYDRIFRTLTKKYGDELGTQYGVELQMAISEGAVKVLQSNDFGGSYKISGLEKMAPKLKGVLFQSQHDKQIYWGQLAQYIERISKAQETLQKTDELARRRFGIDGDATAGGTGRDKAAEPVESLSEAVEAARENVARLKKELSGLQSGKLPENAGKGFSWKTEIENKKKELDEAQNTLDTLLGTASKPGKPDREADKQVENRQKIADELLSLRRKNQQDEIGLMEEGAGKRLAQINLDYENETADILAKEKEWKEAQGGRLTQEQTAWARAALATSYAKRGQSIEERMEEEKKKWQEYFIEFGNYEEKRKSLIQKYDDETAGLEKDGPEYAAKAAEKARALERLDGQYGKSARAMADLFEDAGDKSVSAIQSVIDKYETLVRYMAGTGESDGTPVTADELKGLGFTDKDIEGIEKGEISIRDVADAIGRLKGELKGKSPWQSFLSDIQKGAGALKSAGNDTEKIGQGIALMGKAASSFAPALGEFGSRIAGMSGADGAKIKGAAEALGGLARTAQGVGQAMSGDVAGGAMAAASGISSVVSAIGGLFGADYSRYNRMKEEYDALNEVWDRLIEKKKEYVDIDYGDEARKAGEETEALLGRKLQSDVVLGKERLNSGASAGSHSIGVRQRKGMSDEGWEELRRASEEIGFDYGRVADGRMEGLFDLSAKQLERLQEEAPTFWAKLDDEVKGYLQDIIDCGDEMEGMRERMDETLTGVSFDSFYDNFASMLADMDNDSEAFAESFGDYLKKALLSSLLANKYRQRIRDLYDQWAGYSDSDGDGAFDLERDEAERLKEMEKELADAMTAERDAMAEAFGWDAEGESSRGASSKGIAAASQDSVDYMNGIFTNMQGHTFSINENVARIAEGMGAMAANNSCLAGIGKTMESLISMSGASLNYLAGIESHTAVLETMNENIRYLRSDVNDILLKGVKML